MCATWLPPSSQSHESFGAWVLQFQPELGLWASFFFQVSLTGDVHGLSQETDIAKTTTAPPRYGSGFIRNSCQYILLKHYMSMCFIAILLLHFFFDLEQVGPGCFSVWDLKAQPSSKRKYSKIVTHLVTSTVLHYWARNYRMTRLKTLTYNWFPYEAGCFFSLKVKLHELFFFLPSPPAPPTPNYTINDRRTGFTQITNKSTKVTCWNSSG